MSKECLNGSTKRKVRRVGRVWEAIKNEKSRNCLNFTWFSAELSLQGCSRP